MYLPHSLQHHNHHLNPNPIASVACSQNALRTTCGILRTPQKARRIDLKDVTSLPRLPSYQSVLFVARGGMSDSPPSDPSSVRISGASMSVEPLLGEGSAEPTGTRTRQTDEDVPQTVVFNGKTLTFGDYRRPTLVERASIVLPSLGVVGWRAALAFRRARQTWHKVAVVVVAPWLALLLKSVVSYLYREIVLQPKLKSPESLALPNSRFKDVKGLKVHYLRETPTATSAGGGEEEVPPRSLLHMNHGFGASCTSWESVIPSLSGALRALIIAHDSPGFGLTARAGLRRANKYSLRFNTGITQQLVRDEIQELGSSSTPVILMGHSMGCITAATTSLDPSLPPSQTTLILVSPALSAPSTKEKKRAVPLLEEVVRPSIFAPGVEVSTNEGVYRGDGGGAAGVTRARGGVRGFVRALVSAPISLVRGVRDTMVWTFNWCLLSLFYPVAVLGLRALVYRGNFWRKALRTAWFDESRVDIDVINRYRMPSLVRFWDRGMTLFVLDRSKIGKGGAAGPKGLVNAIAAKAAQGMKVIVVQGENDKLVSLSKATAIAKTIPNAKLLVIPKCGHMAHEEKPQEFLRLVLGQLDQDASTDGNADETDVAATS
ncbi:unnamed protein product [Ascophyllum nodosum]